MPLIKRGRKFEIRIAREDLDMVTKELVGQVATNRNVLLRHKLQKIEEEFLWPLPANFVIPQENNIHSFWN